MKEDVYFKCEDCLKKDECRKDKRFKYILRAFKKGDTEEHWLNRSSCIRVLEQIWNSRYKGKGYYSYTIY